MYVKQSSLGQNNIAKKKRKEKEKRRKQIRA